MCRDGFILHEWQKDKMDALVKYNEIENATNEGKALGIAEGKTLGIAEGKTLGIAEGIKQNKFEIAKNMLKKNMSLEDISEITGLTIYDIKKIKNKEVWFYLFVFTFLFISFIFGCDIKNLISGFLFKIFSNFCILFLSLLLFIIL